MSPPATLPPATSLYPAHVPMPARVYTAPPCSLCLARSDKQWDSWSLLLDMDQPRLGALLEALEARLRRHLADNPKEFSGSAGEQPRQRQRQCGDQITDQGPGQRGEGGTSAPAGHSLACALCCAVPGLPCCGPFLHSFIRGLHARRGLLPMPWVCLLCCGGDVRHMLAAVVANAVADPCKIKLTIAWEFSHCGEDGGRVSRCAVLRWGAACMCGSAAHMCSDPCASTCAHPLPSFPRNQQARCTRIGSLALHGAHGLSSRPFCMDQACMHACNCPSTRRRQKHRLLGVLLPVLQAHGARFSLPPSAHAPAGPMLHSSPPADPTAGPAERPVGPPGGAPPPPGSGSGPGAGAAPGRGSAGGGGSDAAKPSATPRAVAAASSRSLEEVRMHPERIFREGFGMATWPHGRTVRTRMHACIYMTTRALWLAQRAGVHCWVGRGMRHCFLHARTHAGMPAFPALPRLPAPLPLPPCSVRHLTPLLLTGSLAAAVLRGVVWRVCGCRPAWMA